MKRIILSGGGTGGHIYPAVAVAEALKRRYGSDVELLFVGAEGKMEMEKVPALGYNIVGLPTFFASRVPKPIFAGARSAIASRATSSTLCARYSR